MGFVQVWLDVVAIGISNIAAFVRAGKASLNITSYYLSLSKAKQRFQADGILMPHLLQSPTVACNFMTTIVSKRHIFKFYFSIILGTLFFVAMATGLLFIYNKSADKGELKAKDKERFNHSKECKDSTTVRIVRVQPQ